MLFYRRIRENGYIKYYRGVYLDAEIKKQVPSFLKRTNGTQLDNLVEIFKSEYPEYNIETESDFLEKFWGFRK
jgi:hypothetical protein